MSDNSEKLEFGELLNESFDFKLITWNCPDVLSLPYFMDHRGCFVHYKIQSPSFSFAGATWNIEMYPNGLKSQGSLDIMILRTNYKMEKQCMFTKCYFKTRSGKDDKFYFHEHLFCSNKNHQRVIHYKNSLDLIIKKNAFVTDDKFTIMCEMRTKIDIIHRHCKIEPITRVSDPDYNSTLKCPLALSGIKKTVSDLKELFLKQEGCDVIIKVKGQEFPAHRAILIARSPVFASTFRNDMKEKATGILEIEDCDPSSFSDFLCFLYSGTVENLSIEKVFSLFTSADKYDIQDLRLVCKEFMRKNLSISTFCNTITLALQYSEEELMHLSIDFLAKNLQEVIMTVEWQSLLIENPIQCNELMIKALKSNKSGSLNSIVQRKFCNC